MELRLPDVNLRLDVWEMPAMVGVKRRRSRKENGAATVECLVCLPIILSITFATIDLCSAMFLQETLTIAAYEGSRVGVPKSGTNALATAKIQEVLDARGITYDAGVAAFSTPGFDTAGTLDHVTVTVTVPCTGNLMLVGNLFTGRNLQAAVTMRKEFRN